MGLEDILKEILGGSAGGGFPQPQQMPRAPEPPPRPSAGSVSPESYGDGGVGAVMRAVVQIVALRQGFLGGMSSAWTGSGTIVHPSGLILTNCHVADPRAMGMSSPPADRLGIAITERSDEAPAVSYFAQVVAKNPRLDLAVLQIVQDVKGRRVRNLNLPAVPIGDSDRLDLGDKLSIIGYPGIGGQTVTYTSGNVSGFSAEKGVNDARAWIKTDATISGGNSGGTAVTDDGILVGIPTQAAAGRGISPVDARPVIDTNRDGRVDHRDTPMAIGGFINGLRPVKLAVPLLQQAGMKVTYAKPGSKMPNCPIPHHDAHDYEPARPTEKPQFLDLLFSAQVTRDGRPIHPSSHLPDGLDTVYATFEYAGMAPGTPWSVVWMSNGKQIIDQQDRWDEEDHGRKVVKISNQKGLPDGEYHLVLGIGSAIALEGKILVGSQVDDSDSEVSGSVVDDRTGRGISDAAVIVLKPGVACRQFLHKQDRRYVLSNTETEGDGSFKLPKQLLKGQAYSVVFAARGYEMIAVDGALRVSDSAPEHADIGDIRMTPS